jgi:Holliday junction resolvase RusA-like endonuclease
MEENQSLALGSQGVAEGSGPALPEVRGRLQVVRFVIPGKAVPKGRPRVAIRGKFAHAYTPKETRNWEAFVKMLAVEQMNGLPPFDEPVMLLIEIMIEPPRSLSQKKTSKALLGEILPVTKPDLTNVSKGIEDAMNGIVYRDDSLICDLRVTKRYGSQAKTLVEVSPILRDGLDR